MNRRLQALVATLLVLVGSLAYAEEPAPVTDAPPVASTPAASPPPCEDQGPRPGSAGPGCHPQGCAQRATAQSIDRRWWAVGGMAAIYVPLTVWSYFAWYHDVADLPAFKFGGDGLFGEDTYAGGADKLGHFWINLALSRSTAALLRWGGFGRTSSAIAAASASWAFFFFVEIKDGFYFEFSPGDIAGNTTGALAAVAMELWPRLDELVDFRMQYFPSKRFRPLLADGNVDVAEDYSGQIFHVALHLGALPGVKDTRAADYLQFVDFALAYHADNYRPLPDPDQPWDRKQEVFIGLSLNVQAIVDRTLSGGWRKAGHGIFELWQLPYTTLPVVGLSRSPDEPAAKR